MAKLNFSLDGKSLGEFALDKERITIGRRPTNDIHIDNLAVSGEHAMILTLGKDSFLEDLNSTNGTMVNQKLIKKHILQHNDVIEFGKYQLKFLSEIQTKNTNSNGFVKTVLINKPVSEDEKVAPMQAAITPVSANVEEKVEPTSAPIHAQETPLPISSETTQSQSPTASAASIQVTTSAQGVPHLQVLNGADSGRELLLNRAMVKLGTPGAHLAVITKRPHGYFVTHVEGDKHPIVNGHSIGAHAHALNDHDVIALAGLKVEFFQA